ncbi:hypothetical protein BH10ACT11_BH10ACT11_13350 [soil metagenome]
MPDWPALAWLARCGPDSVELLHGSMVEVAGDWAFEGAWAGDFAGGDFDRVAVVAGSGVRIRGGGAHFVAPTSTVDRLCSLRSEDGTVTVSNSLVATLALARAEPLDRSPDKFRRALVSIVRGLEHCVEKIPTSAGPLQLTYFHNLSWDGKVLERRPKPAVGTDFDGFDAYRGFLADGFRRMAANMASPTRRSRLEFLGTVSSGYDANACTALAAEAGCERAICFQTNARGLSDDGVPVARALGVEPVLVELDAWRQSSELTTEHEIPFLALGSGSGLVVFSGAEKHLRGSVLVTGFYGDSIWNPAWPHLGPDIVRKDASGLGLSEYRLRAGFVSCPATFWAAREVDEIVALGGSEEMAPWVTGPDYQRPVPRRILEEAGVDRDFFGQLKSGVPRARPNRSREFLQPVSARDYFAWLRRNRERLGLHGGGVGPRVDRFENWVTELKLRAHVASGRLPVWRRRGRWEERRVELRDRHRSPSRLRRYATWWALERAGEAYEPDPEAD